MLGAAGSCRPYGFSGGGFPPEIHSVAVLPFDNLTPDPTLTQEVSESVRQAVENRLGLRPAAESQADALVRGEISRYESDVPLVYNGTNDQDRVNVTRRQVRITVSVSITDQRQGRTLWERRGITVDGDYEPGPQGERDGRRRALDKLVTTIVEGAQSQW